MGVVRDAEGTPFPGALVRVVDGIEAGGDVLGQETSRWGTYAIGGLPAVDSVALQAFVGSIASPPRWVRPGEGQPGRQDIELAAPASGGAPGAAVGALQGVALDAASGVPVEGVLVTLRTWQGSDVARMLTERQGRFLFLPEQPGRYVLLAEHLAYGTLRSEAMEMRHKPKRVELHMAPAAIEVEGLVVEVEHRVEHLAAAGYYRRQLQGQGTFLDRDAIEVLDVPAMSGVFSRLPGMRVLPGVGGAGTGRDFYFGSAAARPHV